MKIYRILYIVKLREEVHDHHICLNSLESWYLQNLVCAYYNLVHSLSVLCNSHCYQSIQSPLELGGKKSYTSNLVYHSEFHWTSHHLPISVYKFKKKGSKTRTKNGVINDVLNGKRGLFLLFNSIQQEVSKLTCKNLIAYLYTGTDLQGSYFLTKFRRVIS
jgi:hypothetical protein